MTKRHGSLERPKVPTESNEFELICPPWRGRLDCVIVVEISLPAEFTRHPLSIERLEVSLAELSGVVAAQLNHIRGVLRVEVICGAVSAGTLISALYQALRAPQ